MIYLDDVRIPSYEEITLTNPLHVGQFADLKIEEYFDVGDKMYLVRYWENRVGPSDGENFRVVVEARECPNGTWFDVGGLYPYN